MIGLLVSTYWKSEIYELILVIIDWLIKIIYYKLVKVIFDGLRLFEVILDVVIYYHGLSNSIITNRNSLFISKFRSSFCYFLHIKQRLSTLFHPQTERQTEQQKSIIEACFQAFINFKQNNWARFLLMAMFTYHNAKNASTGHIPFEFNYGYHLEMSFKDDVNPCSI